MISEELKQAREYEAARMPQIPPEARPVYHVTANVGWMNDPNGFSVYQGAYHLFYQYHPFSTHWGPMHWGHMKTTDFLRWERLPAAMAPDRPYDREGCWSGGAVELPDGRQLLLYTGRRIEQNGEAEQVFQTQCAAVGDGLDYEKYGGNPVLTGADLPEGCSPADFRDPKLWREPDGTYRAVTVTRTEDGSGAVLLFRSSDGFSWQYAATLDRCRNEYGTMWECPDFFPLDARQVLLVSPMYMQGAEPQFHAGFGTIAILGRYDPETAAFTRESVQTLDHGPDFYAAQTLEALDGRRILIAWMQNWAYAKDPPEGLPCFGELCVPRELSIRDGRLIQNPVRELERLRADPVLHRDVEVSEPRSLDGVRGRALDMTVTVRPLPGAGYRAFAIHAAQDGEHRTSVYYEPERGVIRIDRSQSGPFGAVLPVREFPVRNRDGALKLRLLLDRHSLELFANDGEQAATLALYTTPGSADAVSFEAEGGAVVMDVETYRLCNT